MKKILKWLDNNFECLFLVVFLVLMTVIMMVQVFGRKFFGIALPWAEPFCCHMMIWMGLLGISCTIEEGNAIRFDVIINFISAKARAYFDMIANTVVAIVFIWLTPYTFSVIGDMDKTIAGVSYKMSLVYLICALSVVIIDIRSVQQVYRTFMHLKHGDFDKKEEKKEELEVEQA